MGPELHAWHCGNGGQGQISGSGDRVRELRRDGAFWLRTPAIVLALVVVVDVACVGAAYAQDTCDLSGAWQSTLGPMRLAATSVAELSNPSSVLESPVGGEPVLEGDLRATVAGTLAGSTGEGWVDGAVRGDRVVLRWYLPESYGPPDDAGEGFFELSGNCDHLSGFYRAGFEGEFDQPWEMQRVDAGGSGVAGTEEEQALYKDRESELTRLLVGVARMRAGLDAVRFDLTARAAALSGATDTEVADSALADMGSVSFIPYPGVLRGARGCLLAESGNAYDQSLMLAAMLQARGIRTRLVSAELTSEAAERLLDTAIDVGGTAGPAPELDDPVPGKDVLDAMGVVDVGGFESARAKTRDEREAMLHDAQKEATLQTDRIVGALSESGDGLEIDVDAMRAALIDAARHHVWVQAMLDGQWRDLDPVFTDHGDGSRLAGPVAEVGEIPDELYHRVKFTISIEREEDNALATEKVGFWWVRTANAMGAGAPTFRIRNAPINIPGDTGKTWGVDEAAAGVQAITEATVLGPDAHRPVLTLSTGEIGVGTAFDLTGHLVPDDFMIRMANQAQAAIEGGFGGAGAALGGLFGGEAEQAPASMLTAEWLDIEVTSPDGSSRRERRAIFDRIGPDARAEGRYELKPEWADERAVKVAIVGGFDILVTAGPINAEWRRALRLGALLENEKAMRRGLDLQFARIPLSAGFTKDLVVWPTWLYLFDPLMRDEGGLASGDVALVEGAPQVLALKQGLSVGEDGQLGGDIGFDIVSTGVRALPRAGTSSPDVARAQIRNGARMTILEREIVANWLAGQCPECSVKVAENAAAITNASYAGGGTLITVRPSDLSGLPVLDDGDAQRAMVRELEAGNVLVLPKEPVTIDGAERYAWWRIDPETGETLGMLAGRGGEGHAEYITITLLIVFGDNMVWGMHFANACVDFDAHSFTGIGYTNRTENSDGSTTWTYYPNTRENATSGRGIFNCLGCGLLAATCPINGDTDQFECWTSRSLTDYPTCRSTLSGD